MSNVTAVPIARVKRSYLIYLWVGLALALLAAGLLARQGDDLLSRNGRAEGVVTTASGLQYKVLAPGTGPRPTDADVALVTYEGKLADGTTFDKSEQPTPMPVAGVVPGFSEGLKLMNRGARYRFWLRPELGYGEKGVGPIPPNSVLIFDVQLLDHLPEAALRQLQQGAAQQLRGGGEGPAPR